ncbi:MAG: class I SAM-dependent methyltransferase [Sandaracinaceae bacterium]
MSKRTPVLTPLPSLAPNEPWADPAHHEHAACPVCDTDSSPLVVGTRARFGMRVRNVACRTCGLVRVDPRPSPEAMDAYYRGPYRSQYRTVKLPTGDGRALGPDDPGYMELRAARYRDQASLALRLGQLDKGARVLEVGCRDGQTLSHMARREVSVFGVEPGPEEAAQAAARGVDVFVGLLEEYTPDAPFDQVQMFHVLEHLHDPRGALETLASWLRPGGKLIVEVPNLAQPYGPLEGNFFQNAHLYSFTANTLKALFRRVGLTPKRVVDGGTLFLVGERDALSRPYAEELLDAPEQDGAWVATRLDTYRHLESLRREVFEGGTSMDRLGSLVGVLHRPGFDAHISKTVRDLLAFFGRARAPRAALAVAYAAAKGPHSTALASQCMRAAALYQAQLGARAA